MNAQEATQEYRMNEWIKIIRECRGSGQNVTTWCENNDIKTNRYYYWLRKIRTAAYNALPSTNSKEQIVPIDISSGSLSTSIDSAYVSSETFQADIVIRIGSAVLEIHNSASVSLIENTVRVLQNAR
mgnify:CR=1 FL=1